MDELRLLEGFPPVSSDEWKQLVEGDLGEHAIDEQLTFRTLDGIEIQPLYTGADRPDATGGPEVAGVPPFTRGRCPLGNAVRGWDIRQEVRHPDPARANSEVLADLAAGSRSVLLRLDDADGVIARSLPELERVLAGVDPVAVAVAVDAGEGFLPATAMLAAWWRRSGVAPEQVLGAFRADPLGTLAGRGRLPVSLQEGLGHMADLAAWTEDNLPGVSAIGISSAPFHEAGATTAMEIACSLATGVAYLRACEAAGLSVSAAARTFQFEFPVGCRLFQETAGLRAARRLWTRVVEASGGDVEAQGMRLHVRTSRRVLTRRDPYNNMLRSTAAGFVAAAAGAEVVTTEPFDRLLGLPDEFSRRIARNTHLILQEESNMHRVVDPAGGSWFVEALTDQYARSAWKLFQEIESRGGMARALEGGWIGSQIREAADARAEWIAAGKLPITGVSEFPDPEEQVTSRPDADRSGLRQQDPADIPEEHLSRLRGAVAGGETTALTEAVIGLVEAGLDIPAITAVLASGGAGVELPVPAARTDEETYEALR